MSSSPKSFRRYLLPIRCGEVVKEVPFQKNIPHIEESWWCDNTSPRYLAAIFWARAMLPRSP
jgi:hypothetical protein